jgi:hypothetical protein
MRNLIAVLVLTSALQAQPAVPNSGPPPVPRVVSVSSWPRANELTSYPKVVFVGVEARSVDGASVAQEPKGFLGYEAAVVVFHRNGDGEAFGAGITNSEIRRVAGLEVQASRQPAPFPETADGSETDARVASLVPKGVRFYKLRPLYQNMYTMNNGNSRFADPTTIHDAAGPEHHPFIVSGGMQGLHGWTSAKGLLIPEGAKVSVWKELTDVRAFSLVPRWRWRFPVGTVAVDALSTDKGVFEVRMQTREEDGWSTKVSFRDEAARPVGYSGLQQSCASCHSHTGEIVDVPGRIYRRERWGSDGRFSWRPYKDDGSLDKSWPIDVR